MIVIIIQEIIIVIIGCNPTNFLIRKTKNNSLSGKKKKILRRIRITKRNSRRRIRKIRSRQRERSMPKR